MKKVLLNCVRALDNSISNSFGEIRILFIVRNTIGMASLSPLIKEFLNRGNTHLAITEEYSGCYQWPDEGEVSEWKEKYFINSKASTFKKWHYVFISDISLLWFIRDTTKVKISHGWAHGTSDKKSSKKGEFHYLKSLIEDNPADIYFHNSECDYQFLKPFFKGENSKAHFISGYAKIDSLIAALDSSSESQIEILGLDSSKPTIVICSHFNPKSLYNTFNYHIIESVLASNNYNVLALGHCNLWREGKNTLYNNIEKLSEKYTNFRFIPNLDDNSPILKSADLFIGDTSSIFFEFCVVDKPILFFKHPEFEFESEDIANFYTQAALPFSKIEDIDELIKKGLSEPQKQQQERSRLIKTFIPRRGGVSKYIVDTIVEIGRLSGPNTKKWNKAISLSEKSVVVQI
ncbi:MULTISPECIES: CDP-glycerol glycerophosphotransferase family protein [Colwellia]|uniref:Uncharacterized protein n=1 Tax=Colwellia marinimaniae TaxID=1513592 RepID=A0ABQ0MT59_9GAMM|nr:MULTISPECIES: CDP-glycerol glycerophosphotransferase family protein [Colwellia]GAW95537.1 hypothetical protein MTCD1_01140 [Colwellia marinimaniae]